MQQYRILLFIIVCIITSSLEICGQQYEWLGDYQWSDNECNKTQCCCPHGTLSVIVNETSIGFISNLSGRDCEKETLNLWAPYSTDITEVLGRLYGFILIYLTISENSSIITLTRLDTSNCNLKAKKIHNYSTGTTVEITKFQSPISTTSVMQANFTTISVKVKSSSIIIAVIVVCSIIGALIVGGVSVLLIRRRRRQLLSCPSFLLPSFENIELLPMLSDHRSENKEQFTVIWLGLESIKNSDRIQLRSIIDYFRSFDDPKSCKNYIKTTEYESVFLIVSIEFAENIVSDMYDLHQVRAIYIYNPYDNYLPFQWSLTQIKIKGVFKIWKNIFRQLSDDVRNSNYFPMTIFERVPEEKTTNEVHRYKIEWLWFPLFIDALLEMTPVHNAKEVCVAKFKSYYKGNTATEKALNEFNETYSSNRAILWYTKDTFLYRVLNKALRHQDIEAILLLHFFIVDLHNQLKQEYGKKLYNEPTELYRGQLMSKEEVETLKKARYDHFIYINSFFSTTSNRDLALNIFAGADQAGNDEGKQSVLFELKIDKETTNKVYANTQHLSSVPDENETLFTVGTIFHKYGDVRYDEVQHVSFVQLQLISDKEAQDLCSGGYFTSEYDRIGNATSIYAQFIKVGYLLQNYTQNNFDSVKKYYTLLYPLSPLLCHTGLGYVTSETREFDLAWAHQEEALRIYKSSKGLHDSPDIEFLIYDCLGQSFRRRKIWDLALECYTNIARIGFNFFLLNRSATLHRYFDIAQECEQGGQTQLASDLLAKLKLADPNYYSKVKLDKPRKTKLIRRSFTLLYRWWHST
ncbi:unnamed protein product [Rotaria sp. Silwood2]|nr:unnamed protein product [Rotaria sp. Silwood2]CAF4407266.1 unnamed protein product [Rotaria sp. Silwood2]